MIKKRRYAHLILGILIAFYAMGLAAQEPSAQKSSEKQSRSIKTPPIRVDTTLVAVPVTVVDPFNRFVTGLQKENFRVFEDNVEQKISRISIEDAAISIGLVVDSSGSMGEKLTKSKEALKQFLNVANPADSFFLIQFHDKPVLLADLTHEPSEILERLLLVKAQGRTALFDAIYLALDYARKTQSARKALLIISDGGDNGSRYTEEEVKKAVREADVQIYAIGIFEPSLGRGRTPEEARGPGLLTQISEWTGGRHFPIEDSSRLPEVADKIGQELHNQYILYYTPENTKKDGRYRRIKVKLDVPRGLPSLKAYFRTGYYSPYQ